MIAPPASGARRLTYKLPVRCRTEEERIALQRWRATAPSLVVRAKAADAAWSAFTQAMQAMFEFNDRLKTCAMVEVLAQAMSRCPAEVLSPMHFVMIQDDTTGEILAEGGDCDPDATLLSVGAKVRAKLPTTAADRIGGPPDRYRAAAAQALASLTDEQLGNLVCVPDQETLNQLFGSIDTEAIDAAAFQAAHAQIQRQRAARQAESDRVLAATVRVQAEARPVVEDFVAAFRAARRLLPASGECADLAEALGEIEGRCGQMLGAEFTRVQLATPERPNPIMCRLPWWQLFAQIRWSEPKRVLLRRFIEEPETMGQLDVLTPKQREVQKELAVLASELPIPPQRRRPEFKRLMATLERPDSTDPELAWAFCEYVAAETPLRHSGGEAHPASEPITANAEGEGIMHAAVDIPGTETLHGCMFLFADVSIYDGQAVC
jgi:hypothetical protein